MSNTALNDTTSLGRQKATLGLYKAVEQFQEISPTMPVGEALMFLSVALHEGSSLTELAEYNDCRKSTASRYLLNLSDKKRNGDKGHGVVEREIDPHELRRNMYSLSAKGRKIVDTAISKMTSAIVV